MIVTDLSKSGLSLIISINSVLLMQCIYLDKSVSSGTLFDSLLSLLIELEISEYLGKYSILDALLNSISIILLSSTIDVYL